PRWDGVRLVPDDLRLASDDSAVRLCGTRRFLSALLSRQRFSVTLRAVGHQTDHQFRFARMRVPPFLWHIRSSCPPPPTPEPDASLLLIPPSRCLKLRVA